MLFSIIIPVYNVEAYLKKCIDSVLIQTYNDYEIILVNDGSTDGSSAICRDYSTRNQQIKLIVQENRGVSAARNAGIAEAKGDYLLFLDADDKLKPGALAVLDEELSINKPDIIMFNADVFEDISKKFVNSPYKREQIKNNKIISGREYFVHYYLEKMLGTICLCIFKRMYLKNNSLWFAENQIYEDVLFFFQSLMKADTVKTVEKDLYIRRIRSNSIMTSEVKAKNIENMLFLQEETYKFLTGLVDTSDKGFLISLGLYSQIVTNMVAEIIDKCKVINKEERKNYYYKSNITFLYVIFMLTKKVQSVTLPMLVKYQIVKMKEVIEDGKIIDNLFLNSPFALDVGMTEQKCNEDIEKEYRNILNGLPLNNKNITVGIYGTGRHTVHLIKNYDKYCGRIEAELLFIDSYIPSYQKKYIGFDIINIREAEKLVDCVILSSFIYEKEFMKNCSVYLSENIPIIRFYEEEKVSIW